MNESIAVATVSSSQLEAASVETDDSIVVRKPRFELSEDLPHYWYDGQPFATHYLDALSSVFPDGEAFFVRSVHHYRDQITDPHLRAKIAAFAAQEGQHSHQHRQHLNLLLGKGYRMIEFRNRIMNKALRFLNRKAPRFSLAMTAALEHLTALLARQMLSDPESRTEPMGPLMAPLWRWHALEEAEHKAVAYDVLMIVAPGLTRRRLAMVSATFGLLFDSGIRAVYMLWFDGKLWNRQVWSDGLRFLVGKGGMYRGLGPDYVQWFRSDFHPDDIDDRKLIESERAWQESYAS